MDTIMQTRLSRRTMQKLALALPASLLLAAPRRALAQEATPGALSAELQQFADDTYAFVNSGYISLFIVTDEGVIATDPGSQGGPERAEAYKAAIASVTDQPVRYLIYSHDHADHATGGEVFADTATFISPSQRGRETRGPQRSAHPGARDRLQRPTDDRARRQDGRALLHGPQSLRQQHRAALPRAPAAVRRRLHPGRTRCRTRTCRTPTPRSGSSRCAGSRRTSTSTPWCRAIRPLPGTKADVPRCASISRT